MLECRACVSRAVRAIASDGQYGAAALTRPLALTPHIIASRPQRRRLATVVERDAPAQDALSVLEPVERPAVEQNSHRRAGKMVIANEKALRKELDYLRDPIKLADHVNYTLRSNLPDKALDLCRLASRNMTCTVSWNHVLAWQMQKGQVTKAMDTYNEMKKRGQFPDSYTYMRLLTGFSHHKEHVTKAVSVYHSMSSPTSRVKPSIMHTNAALRVCSLAQDMDALWGIVSKLPEKGANAPDSKTYTTILQAIRHNAMGNEADPSQMARQRNDAVNEGRRIWQEIITKWRNAELEVDEMLVAAMADLLLISRRMQDWDDVLSLVQQTTKLERLVVPFNERATEHVPRPAEDGGDAEHGIILVDDHEGFMPTPSANAFKPVTAAARDSDRSRKSRGGLAWVQPGNAILSILIRACSLMRTPKTANAYWDTLTSAPYNITPDVANFHNLIRLLRNNRSSVRVSHVLQRMHGELGMQAIPVTYAMAMSVCARDHKNPNVMDIAESIVGDMEKHLHYPDAQTLEAYFSLAHTRGNGPEIIHAVNRIQALLDKMLSSPNDSQRKVYDGTHGTSLEYTAIGLYQSLIGAVNTLLSRKLIPNDAIAHWEDRRKALDADLSSVKFRLDSTKQRLEVRRKSDINEKEVKGLRKEDNIAEAKLKWERGKRSVERGSAVAAAAEERGERLVGKRVKRPQVGARKVRPFRVKDKNAPKKKDGFADLPGELGM
ncbi:putative tetratricopeptide-like helical domain superfamily [Septoria linicola]|nr:putative tetratricopeptide-like helical domain superfamily [Septoria linicola]